MVKSSVLLAIVIIVVLAASAGYYIYSQSGSPANSETIDMEVTAGTPQNGGPDHFLPANFTITEGDHVTIVFDNTDDGPHEFEIPALSVTTGIVQGGQTQRVTFVPTKTGTFPYDQPAGACVSQVDPNASCTGAQETNGFVTVIPPS
jgi:plastocyanin